MIPTGALLILLAALVLMGSGRCQSGADFCPPLWQRWGNSCYRVIATQLSWQEAGSACQDLGGELAAPRSLPENTFLASMVQLEYSNSNAWIGCNDLETPTEWKCNGHKNGISFFNWYHNYQYTPGYHCVSISPLDMRWYNNPCTEAKGSVCVYQPRRLHTHSWLFSAGNSNPDRPTSCLVNHVIKEFVITSIPSCAFACINEPRCRSVNIRITEEGGEKVCQLNDSIPADDPNSVEVRSSCINYSGINEQPIE